MVAFGAVGSYPPSPFTAAGTASMPVPYPAGISAGAPLVLVAALSNSVTFGNPSGWTVGPASTSGGVIAQVWTKTAVGNETGSLTLTANGSSAGIAIAGAMLDFSGAAVSPFGSTVSANSGFSSSTSSTAAGTLSPAPGASDLTVRLYCWAMTTTGTHPTITNPGGTWTTELNLITAIASGGQNVGIVVADKIAGTDNQTLTASAAVYWFVADLVIKAGASATKVAPRLYSVAMRRASLT